MGLLHCLLWQYVQEASTAHREHHFPCDKNECDGKIRQDSVYMLRGISHVDGGGLGFAPQLPTHALHLLDYLPTASVTFRGGIVSNYIVCVIANTYLH